MAKVNIDELGNYSVAIGRNKAINIMPEDLEAYLVGELGNDSTAYIALHADQDIAYKEVVRVLDIANQHKMKLVIATKK